MKLIPITVGHISATFVDTGKKPSREDILEQMKGDWIKYSAFAEYFDDELAFERHLIRKWSNEYGD